MYILTTSELFHGELYETFVFLLAIFLPLKLPFASPVFRRTVFEEVLSTYVADCLA